VIVIGWDTGSGHCAHCLLDVTRTSATYISSGVIEVGHMVPLAKPRTFRGGRRQTEERVVLSDDIGAFYSQARGMMAVVAGGIAWPRVGAMALPELCAIERRPRVSPRGERAPGVGGTVSAELASQLKTSAEMGMIVYAVAAGLGYRVELASPEETRKATCGNAHAEDSAVKAFCELAITGWPKKSNYHVRDAAITALVCARREMTK
jgi:Holliday junction resolvasome RuvABC endonuclease subunit